MKQFNFNSSKLYNKFFIGTTNVIILVFDPIKLIWIYVNAKKYKY